MREIKFRAWDKENKKFYDDIFGIDDSGQVILIEQGTVWTTSEYVVAKNCIPLQYTGLKDKNGKEIYEGDIFIHKNNHKFVVQWDEDRFIGLDNKRNGDGYCCYISSCDELGNSAIEVIGNIYENPELMKGGNI